MIDLSGRTVLVTGGAQGIGRGICRRLLECGASVVVADCDQEAGQEFMAELDLVHRCCFTHTDVGDESSVQSCVQLALERFGALDGLVNNAGLADPGKTPVTELSLDQWERMIRTNLTGSFLMVKHTAEHLGRRNGAIVNIASTRALQSEPDTEAYSASKGGLVALTHALAISLAHKVRVNAILPGWIDVSAHQKTSKKYEVKLSREDNLQHPVGRVGTPNDVASLTSFLLSDEAGFITAQSFVVDGGMTRKMIYAD